MIGQKRAIIFVGLMSLCLCATAFAQADESATAGEISDSPGSRDITSGVGSLEGLLFIGTSQNSSDPTATLNDVFTVDPATDISASILSQVQVWGATADIANARVLFTRSDGVNFGNELFEIPCAGGTPTSLGTITITGAPLRIDGLAFSGGLLYGVQAGGGGANGLYEISLADLSATFIAPYGDSISGIDADVDGIIYGVNDSTGNLVTLGTDGTITNVAAYPAGLTDIDGIAVSGGFAYLVTDESQPISVYDLINDVYVADLTSPFTSADVFSGAALCPLVDDDPNFDIEIPTVSRWGLALLATALLGISLYLLRRRAL